MIDSKKYVLDYFAERVTNRKIDLSSYAGAEIPVFIMRYNGESDWAIAAWDRESKSYRITDDVNCENGLIKEMRYGFATRDIESA